MYAFLSYQTADKVVAGKVKAMLESISIPSFLAHEDIEISNEWRSKILEEIEKTDIFIPILSKHYYTSPWCQQESGIAAFRKMTVIPISTDGSIPSAFLSSYQSAKIDPEKPDRAVLFPGIAKHNASFLIDNLIQVVRNSRNYRGAEANFALISPYLSKASNKQIVDLLHASALNDQVCNAGECAQKYLPPLVKSYGHLRV